MYLLELDYLITALVMLVMLSSLLKEKIRQYFREVLHQKPRQIFLVPIFFIILNQWHAGIRNLPTENGIAYALYLLIPVFLIFMADPKKDSLQIADALIILLLWLPFDLRYLQGAWEKLNYQFLSVSASILGITLFCCFRRLDDVKFNLNISKKDILFLASSFILMASVLIPIGIFLDFLGWNPNYHLIKILPVAFAISFITTALPEELLFRGFLQNLLGKTLKNNWNAVFLTALIFGSAHLDNITGNYGPPNWRYFIMASIAGMGYGIAFLRSKSIIVPAALHALVDVVWGAFLVKA
ncbi:MAG: type II CAAX endopeptidase family protein [bacterium]|nr:type II CAAX endopeptidase family protein [bacterium]